MTVKAPLDELPLFVRGGALLPMSDSDSDRLRTEEPSRALHWFAALSGEASALLYEDDGLHRGASPDRYRLHRFATRADASGLQLSLASEGGWTVPYGSIRVVLPGSEMRRLTMDAAERGVTLRR